MVITITVTNETPYTWYHSYEKDKSGTKLKPHGTATGRWPLGFSLLKYPFRLFDAVLDRGVYLSYGNHSKWDLHSDNRIDDFTVRESDDREHFELVNSSDEVVDRCPNYARIEEEKLEREERKRRQQEEKRQREEEEQRRQAELERKRKIQEETKRRQEQERREWERRERVRREQERQEHERREWERQERERREWERQEQVRLELERQKQERQERELREWEQWKKRQKELQRKRQEEEKRRLAELEQARRIQEQIDWENKTSKRKIRKAQERLQEQEQVRAREHQQQKTEVLYQLLDNHTAYIERDEFRDVQQRFEELLSSYQIKEKEKSKINLEDRMKSLQNVLILNYLEQHNIPIWSQWALDQATGYVDLSLTERFSVLEAVVKVTLEGEPDFQSQHKTGQDKKNKFFLSLEAQLQISNPTLARRVLVNILEITSKLPKQGKEILSQILFNNIWTPKEIKLFIGQTLGMDQEKVSNILHWVCTYRLSCILAVTALNHKDPIGYIRDCISCEEDKDHETLLSEMQENNYPEDLLSQLEDTLQYVEAVLPRCKGVDLESDLIEDCKRWIVSIDFSNPNTDMLKSILIVMSIAVKTCTTFITSSGKSVQGYFPRLTQLASLLLLLLQQSQNKRGCLLEIGTGEGKTCILAMFATIQAIRGTAVDVVTSSPLLAIRDQEEWKKLYAMFGVTSSTVPPQHQIKSSFEDHDKLLEEAYSMQVVYGTVCTFAADILRQEFEKKTTRGQRKFDCVIVDEVDYMTLDSGVQVTFLSHQASGLRHLEQVLASIWALMSTCRPIEIFETGEIQWGTRIQYCHKVAKQAVVGLQSDFSEADILLLGVKLGLYSQEDLNKVNEAVSQTQAEKGSSEDPTLKVIGTIMAKLGHQQQHELFRELETAVLDGVVVDCYSLVNNKAKRYGKDNSSADPDVRILLLQNGCACEIMSEKSLIESTLEKLKSKIRFSSECSLKSVDETQGYIVIPSFLKEYVENQLPIFAENALRAIQMALDREYMIEKTPEVDRPGFCSDDSHHYDAIIPVDFQASGVLEKNKRWGEGLQQFLEMKHQLAISQLSNVTNYMSNVHFFKKYLTGKGIFGVSGTLGGKAEKAFLKRQYKTASYIIPAHRHKKLVELPAVQVSGGKTEWIQVICETTWRAADRGQVVLIICEDVKTAKELKGKVQVQKRHSAKISMYTISEKHNIEKETFRKGHIIIATNLGGRGTDIHVHQEVNECGGLFVLLTYFPGSHRVERQVFGRTARKGNPGMAQMILNRDLLAQAYQGHSVETMRQLREEYEVRRLDGMEKNELLQIEIKENLFSTFCEFLCDFDKHYTEEERRDIKKLKSKDLPECFRSHRQKFDYETAINALKESWALWLILHEEDFSRHNDILLLKENLMKGLKNTADQILKGRKNNFYDYIKLAKSRTDIHRSNKKESDFGALLYWQSAVQCDPFYCAVALYNQAYITVNLQRSGYKEEAKQLLEKAKTAVDVYLSESTNTMMFCNLAMTNDFLPHHKDSNLQNQMKARMSVFKCWKGYIENALKALQHIENSKGEAILEDSSVYSLSKDKDPITMNEIMVLHEFGLCIVFDVKKKPEFSIDAFACFCLGVVQVAAGVLVCALSYGSASQFGLGLISEGVSDMIHGIKGMIQGSFDWAEWAISKAISIGVSLVFGGLSKLKGAVRAVRSGAKGLVAGAKCSSILTVKECCKHAGKFAVQELAKQGCVAALSYTVSNALPAVFKRILNEAFRDKVFSMIKANSRLESALTNFICSAVPKTAMEQNFTNFTIDMSCENEIRLSVDIMTRDIIPDLMMDCTQVGKVLDTLSEVCGSVARHMEKQKEIKVLMKVLESAQYIKLCVEILNSFPTEDVIHKAFVPGLLKSLDQLPQEKYDKDGRHSLADVKRLKKDLLHIIASSVLESFVEACSRHMTSIITRTCMTQINSAASSAVGNLLGRANTQGFFDNQLYKHQMKEAIRRPCESLSEESKQDFHCYIEEVCDVDRPASALDIHVLTQSDALQGKGIRVIVVDKDKKKLSEDYFPGKDSSAGDIVLQLSKDPEAQKQTFTERLAGETRPYSGHFDIVKPDGAVIPVNSADMNCFYHAVVQATSCSTADHKQRAVQLRSKVKHLMLQDTAKYAAAVNLQRGYEETHRYLDKYIISGGGRKTQQASRKDYNDKRNTTDMHDLQEHEADLIKTYDLGLVGRFDDIKGLRRTNRPNADNNNQSCPVNADHIPPINTFQKAHEMLQKPENEALRNWLETSQPKLYAMIDKTGKRGLCREVLTEHHKQALTTGNSKGSHRIREKLAEVLISGDSHKAMKLSLIAANPEMSESLRRDAGIYQQNKRPDVMSTKATRTYHGIGDRLLLDKYCEMGVINQSSKDDLHQWTKSQLYSRNSAEYHELLEVLKPTAKHQKRL
ncbi:PREDICTED: uncharacterized protein LOC106918565 [Poecilia mexicana]|uniref:uncharacterized protein LOC106918565 n=1 Tax=Poecilia mexicana TaxID=48701 RepID=UPI00072EA820|nr:PREDICTED: uncharacterized protein LOC106918565 [Poecilia mexicana]